MQSRFSILSFIRSSAFDVQRSAFVLISILLLQGCTSSSIPVALSPKDQPPVTLKLSRAFYAPTQSGEDQIVLLSDPIDDPIKAAPGNPLPVEHQPEVWHVLLIDLHWRSAPLGNLDSPVASNAALHWYVIAEPSATSAGVLHYEGQGSVWLSPKKDGADISVKSGEVNLIDQVGSIRDPFKAFKISSEFHAVTNSDRVHEVMDSVKRKTQAAEKQSQ
jgi:hypothetical protein